MCVFVKKKDLVSRKYKLKKKSVFVNDQDFEKGRNSYLY